MAKYTVISDIGKGILSLLKDKLVPDVIDNPNAIGICEPKERGSFVVGIHPYDIKEDKSGENGVSESMPDGSTQDAPAMIEMYYMISVSSKANAENKALEEAKIIGKVIQILKDNPIIPSKYMPGGETENVISVSISMLPMEMEEKVKVWTMFGESYKLSVFYIVGPVALDSENIRKPKPRVESIYLGSNQFSPRKIIQFETRIKEEDIDDEWTQKTDDEENNEDEDMDDLDNDGEDENDDFSLDDESNSDESGEEELDEGEEDDFSLDNDEFNLDDDPASSESDEQTNGDTSSDSVSGGEDENFGDDSEKNSESEN